MNECPINLYLVKEKPGNRPLLYIWAPTEGVALDIFDQMPKLTSLSAVLTDVTEPTGWIHVAR